MQRTSAGQCISRSLLHTAKEYGCQSRLLEATLDVNHSQRQVVIQKLQEKLYIIKGRTIGLLGLALPALFVIGYIVMGIWIGEWILGRSSPAERERPYLAAVVGLTVVGVVSIIPTVGGVISFVGFGAVMLLSWRVLRGTPAAAPSGGLMRVADAAS